MRDQPGETLTGYEAYRCLLQLFAGPEKVDIADGIRPLAEFLGMDYPKGHVILVHYLEVPEIVPTRVMLWALAEAALHQALCLEDFAEHGLNLAETFRKTSLRPRVWVSLAEARNNPNL